MMPIASLVLLNDGHELSYSFDEMLKYHGGNSPAGVALAFKVLERAFPLLADDGRVERREIAIATAFAGPGARDAFELVTRAVTQERFTVDRSLAVAELGRARERFVFHLRHRDHSASVTLRDGFVTDEFIDLTRREDRSAEDEDRLTAMKHDLAGRVMAATASAVFDASGTR
jgi:hypothetical protein